MSDKEATLTVYAKNRYELSMNEYGDLSTRMATAAQGTNVLHATIDDKGNRSEWRIVPGTYKENVFKAAGFHIDDDGLVTTSAYKIETERTSDSIYTVIADKDVYQTLLEPSYQRIAAELEALHKEAAPTKLTFRPSAVRYELGKDDVEKLGSVLSGMYNPEGIYRVVTTNSDQSTLGTLNNDSLFDMIGCKRLSSGNASMRDKAISLFQLENGFTIKIGSTYLLVATTAQPKFKQNDEVYITVLDGDTPNVLKTQLSSAGVYDATAQDFLYTTTDGKQVAEKDIRSVPETPSENQQSVTMNHF